MTYSNSLTAKKVLVIVACLALSFCLIYSVSAQGTTVNASASTTQPTVGSTLTVTIAVSNVQNLFGADVSLLWNPTVLSLSNVALNVGDAQSNGVLHGTINRDYNTISAGDLYVNETKVSGSYSLIAQSIGHSTPSFSGSGTIATLTFNVIAIGSTGFILQTDLADQAVVGQTSNNIAHQDIASSVTAVAAGSSSTPSSSATISDTPTPSVPEFPTAVILALFIALAIVGTALAKKQRKNLAVHPSFRN
jgi:hypothetical protein